MGSDDMTRVVLAGCGGISAAWLSAVQPRNDVQIVGLVDLNEESAQKRAAEFGLDGAMIGSDLKNVLQATMPDAVFDCTVPEAHVSVTLAALEHGCHVLGEKPLADSMDNARRMVAAATGSGKTYAVIQNRRYDQPIRTLCKFLRSGAIGQITTVHSDFFIGAHFGGFRDHMEHVLLLDMAIHTFDAARLITGQDPVTVLCSEWNPAGSWYDHAASAVAIFEMTQSVVYCYRGSWCAEGRNTAWESEWRIIGDKGTVTWNGGKEFQVQVVAGNDGFTRPLTDLDIPLSAGDNTMTNHAGVIYEFIDCIRDGVPPQTICTDNIKSLSMVHGAIESAVKGSRLQIDSV